jgi:5-formyltetrahydrofolate cyclo-ligase
MAIKTDMPCAVKPDKAALRRAVLSSRCVQKAESREIILSKLLALPLITAAETVFCYVSAPLEADTHGFIGHMLQMNKTVCVPRCRGGKMSAVVISSFHDLEPPGKHGFREPVPSLTLSLADTDIIIVPGLLFDRGGYRLGYGGGYYDRRLAESQGYAIGICRHGDYVDLLPRDSHDIPVDLVVTDG